MCVTSAGMTTTTAELVDAPFLVVRNVEKKLKSGK